MWKAILWERFPVVHLFLRYGVGFNQEWYDDRQRQLSVRGVPYLQFPSGGHGPHHAHMGRQREQGGSMGETG